MSRLLGTVLFEFLYFCLSFTTVSDSTRVTQFYIQYHNWIQIVAPDDILPSFLFIYLCVFYHLLSLQYTLLT